MSEYEQRILLMLLELRRDFLQLRLALLRQKKKPIPQTSPPDLELRLPSAKNKKKILRFIRSSRVVRAKDIVDEFNILSARTVKRNLHELAAQGFVRREVKAHNVYYSLTDRKNA